MLQLLEVHTKTVCRLLLLLTACACHLQHSALLTLLHQLLQDGLHTGWDDASVLHCCTQDSSCSCKMLGGLLLAVLHDLPAMLHTVGFQAALFGFLHSVLQLLQ